MTKRSFNVRERLLGVKCWKCGDHLRVREKVENHHLNGNRFDNRRVNQVWLCKPCHALISATQKTGRPVIKSNTPASVSLAKSGGKSICVRKNEGERGGESMGEGGCGGGGCATEVLKDEVDYGEGSAQMRVNNLAEMPWRNYCEAVIRRDGRVRKKQCLNAGAEAVGISQATAYRYYGKWVSEEGPCVEYKDDLKRWWVVWRRVPENLITPQPSEVRDEAEPQSR